MDISSMQIARTKEYLDSCGIDARLVCASMEDGKLLFANSYFDESWYAVPMGDKKFMLSNRKLSTYINALARQGFLIEQLIEENDETIFSEDCSSPFEKKAKMLPVTFVIRARKM